MTTPSIPGIHHVTAITSDAVKNIDFYRRILGLRLVKVTVNFDDPSSYHLYYGDELGRPGTILTFFAWPAHRGIVGAPQVAATAFAISRGAIQHWTQRLREFHVKTHESERFGNPVLSFEDFDGMQLELIESDDAPGHSIHRIHGITLVTRRPERSRDFLTDVMKFKAETTEANRSRFRAGASTIDLFGEPEAKRGNLGAGVVHHVAFRTPDDAQQVAWQEAVGRHSPSISPVMDRVYFHSIYFLEPGGVLFEIATDGPGFTVDEEKEKLGTSVRLPPWLEPQRAAIEKSLPPLPIRQTV